MNQTTQIIFVEKKQVYGNELIYPMNFINELGVLTGKKTLSNSDIEALKAMDFKVILMGAGKDIEL